MPVKYTRNRMEVPLQMVSELAEELARLARSVGSMRESLLAGVEELRAERSLFAAMTGGLDEGLLLVDSDLRVIFANAAFAQIFTLDFDPVGRRLTDVIRNPLALSRIESCLKEHGDFRETVTGPAGSSRAFELHVTSLELPDQRRGSLVLFFDITRLEALEQVRQRFIADVSHELRTPVTSIRGAIETLMDVLGEGDSRRPIVDIAQRQADRMTDLIADLTDLSRIETGAIELECSRIPLHGIVSDVMVAVSARHHDRDVDISVDVDRELQVYADPRRLEQILTNLVDNGVKYTPNGGAVTVSARQHGAVVSISVRDTGPGIPQDSLEKIFNRFYRVDQARSREMGGTGLGLAIVKHLVKLHRGLVHVVSSVGEGSTFTVDLPDSEA